MKLQEHPIIHTLQTLAKATSMKNSIFHQEFKRLQLISSTYYQTQKVSLNCTWI